MQNKNFSHFNMVEFTLFLSLYYVFFLFVLLFLKGNYENTLNTFLIVQAVSLILYLSIPLFNILWTNTIVYVIIGIHIIFGMFLLYHYFTLGLPYGYDAVDAYFYEDVANNNVNLSFSNFISILKKQNVEISDWGFPSIRFFVAKLFSGIEAQNIFLVFLNILCVAFSTILIGKISRHYMDDIQSIKLVMLLWGLNGFAFYTNVSGLKENFFVFIIIIAFYFFENYKADKKYNCLLLSIFFAILTVFFRWYITVFILLVFILNTFYRYNSFHKVFPAILIILLISGLLFQPFVELFGLDNPFFRIAVSVQNSRSRGSLFGVFVNSIASLIGPFPSFIPVREHASLIYAVGNLIKMILSFFFIVSVLQIIRNKNYKFYGIILFVFINIFLVNVSNSALDMRFQYTALPFFILISVHSLKELKEKDYKLFILYVIFIMTPLIYFYNLR